MERSDSEAFQALLAVLVCSEAPTSRSAALVLGPGTREALLPPFALQRGPNEPMPSAPLFAASAARRCHVPARLVFAARLWSVVGFWGGVVAGNLRRCHVCFWGGVVAGNLWHMALPCACPPRVCFAAPARLRELQGGAHRPALNLKNGAQTRRERCRGRWQRRHLEGVELSAEMREVRIVDEVTVWAHARAEGGLFRAQAHRRRTHAMSCNAPI